MNRHKNDGPKTSFKLRRPTLLPGGGVGPFFGQPAGDRPDRVAFRPSWNFKHVSTQHKDLWRVNGIIPSYAIWPEHEHSFWDMICSLSALLPYLAFLNFWTFLTVFFQFNIFLDLNISYCIKDFVYFRWVYAHFLCKQSLDESDLM